MAPEERITHYDPDSSVDVGETSSVPTDAAVTSRLPSLAQSSTTPRCMIFLIPLLTLIAHGLFIYGQTAPMWRLHLAQDMNVWANASDFSSRSGCDALGLPHANNIVVQTQDDVRVFTYNYVITELWQAKGMPGSKFLPRLTALLLVFCSGIWPHLKLLLLNITFLYPMQNLVRRKRFLHWLATLGKWSLADVLTVCVMLAVLNLEWHVDPDAVKHGLLDHLPLVVQVVHAIWKTPASLCDRVLGYKCHHPKRPSHVTNCKLCKSLVYEAYNHPSWAKTTGKSMFSGMRTSGGGYSKLSVLGMRGIYSFCFAVVLSILLSLIVDILDTQSRRAAAREQQDSGDEDQGDNLANVPLLEETGNATPDVSSSITPSSQTTAPPSPSALILSDSNNGTQHSWLWWDYQLLPLLLVATVALAINLNTMGRRAFGAVPLVLEEILGLSWERLYSFRDLMRITGEAGGWDMLLMATFNLSVVLGPVVRSILCVVALSKWTPDRWRPFWSGAVDFVSAFCAWEVLLVSIFMESLLMPSITETIFMAPECYGISPDSCFKVKFDILGRFGWIVVGLVLLLVTSAVAAAAGRKCEPLLLSEPITSAGATSDTDQPYVALVSGDDEEDEAANDTEQAAGTNTEESQTASETTWRGAL